MAKYIDLSSVVDVEPEVCEVLPLIEDDDLQYEFWQRLDEEFYPCKPDIFEKTYERVIDEAD